MLNLPEAMYTLKAGTSLGRAFSIKIVSAKNLAVETKAYVKVSLEGQHMKTDALKRSVNPVWNQLLFFARWGQQQICQLQVWGQRSGRDDRFLGSCEFPFPMEPSGLSFLDLNLQSDRRYRKSVQGNIQVELCNLDLRKTYLTQTVREADTLASLKLKMQDMERGVTQRARTVSDLVQCQQEVTEVNGSLLARKIELENETSRIETENRVLETTKRGLVPHCEKIAAIRQEITRLVHVKNMLEAEIEKASQQDKMYDLLDNEQDYSWERDEIIKESVALQQAEITSLEEANFQLEFKLLRVMRDRPEVDDKRKMSFDPRSYQPPAHSKLRTNWEHAASLDGHERRLQGAGRSWQPYTPGR